MQEKNLSYWKGALIDVRQAQRRAVLEKQPIGFIRDLSKAVRFALRRIHDIELNTFKIGEIQ